MSETKSGVELIAAERVRQVKQEGWTAPHDDRHRGGELAQAAQAYLFAVRWSLVEKGVGLSPIPFALWPWERKWWKPSEEPVRNLVKAGALIAAEIDRLQRAALPSGDPQ